MVTSGNGSRRSATVGTVIGDIAELVELQLKLIALNSQEAKSKAVSAAMMGTVAAGLFAMACLFTLGAVALALYQYTELAMWSAFAVVGLSCLAVAGILGWLASRHFKECTHAWSVSKRELSENVRWLKQSLTGHAPPSTRSETSSTADTYHPHFERH